MNPYKTLGVAENATVDEIKKAYKALARKLHPDKNIGSTDDSKIKEVNEAYAILSDPVKKQQFDQCGQFSEVPIDLSEMLSGMFFASSRGGNPIKKVAVPVTLADVLHGRTKRIEFRIDDKCGTCNGVGTQDPKDVAQCVLCNGTGYQHVMIAPMMATRMTCSSCMGQGKSIKADKACKSCAGSMSMASKRIMDIRVPIGVQNGMTRLLPKKGSFNPDNQSYQDVQLCYEYVYDKACMSVHANCDVSLTIDVKLAELLHGFKKRVSLYDVETTFVASGYMNPAKSIMIPGMGLPVYKDEKTRGNLHVNVNVVFPDNVDVNRLLRTKKRDPEPVGSDASNTFVLDVK